MTKEEMQEFKTAIPDWEHYLSVYLQKSALHQIQYVRGLAEKKDDKSKWLFKYFSWIEEFCK